VTLDDGLDQLIRAYSDHARPVTSSGLNVGTFVDMHAVAEALSRHSGRIEELQKESDQVGVAVDETDLLADPVWLARGVLAAWEYAGERRAGTLRYS